MGAVEISGPGKRWGHTCNAIKGGELLYIFGGYGKDNCQTNQVHVFDTGRCSRSILLFIGFLFHFPLPLYASYNLSHSLFLKFGALIKFDCLLNPIYAFC